ncbi:ribosome silencing factor [Candidatus Methylospira mobilis]
MGQAAVVIRNGRDAFNGCDFLADVLSSLDAGKGADIKVLDVRNKTSITDYMVIASGTSERHVCSLADRIVDKAREIGVRTLSLEGKASGDWVLVDLGEVIIHVMKPQTREFYQLEKLWMG